MIYVTKTYLPPFEEYCDEIRRLWDSHIVSNMGPLHEAFGEAMEKYLGVRHVSLFANGHLALEAALRALDLPSGSEVITTPLTFPSTVNAIIRSGLVPVFADVLEADGTMDPASAERLAGSRTSAIMPVHVYGNVCDDDALRGLASTRGLKLIYDAAHAFGVRYRGVGALSLGDASVLSFHATKVFSTAEGGAVCFGDGSLEQRLCDEKNFGIRDYEECVSAGGNGKMNELQAAMGICNLRHVGSQRRQVYELYRELLPDVRFLEPREGVEWNFAYVPALFEDRDAVYDRLLEGGVMARKYFYPPVNEFGYCRAFRSADTPVASRLSRQLLCLPIYPGLSPQDVRRICELLTR